MTVVLTTLFGIVIVAAIVGLCYIPPVRRALRWSWDHFERFSDWMNSNGELMLLIAVVVSIVLAVCYGIGHVALLTLGAI